MVFSFIMVWPIAKYGGSGSGNSSGTASGPLWNSVSSICSSSSSSTAAVTKTTTTTTRQNSWWPCFDPYDRRRKQWPIVPRGRQRLFLLFGIMTGLSLLSMIIWPHATSLLPYNNPSLEPKRVWPLQRPFKNVTNVAMDAAAKTSIAGIAISCEWKPNNEIIAPCVDFLTRRLSHALVHQRHTRTKTNSVNSPVATPPAPPPPLSQRRWILLGDSTMARLYKSRPINDYLSNPTRLLRSCPHHGYDCTESVSQGCDTDQLLHMERRDVWIPPNNSIAEGPKGHGLTHPFCTDCTGCNSAVMLCKQNTKTPPKEPCVLQSATAKSTTPSGFVEQGGSGSAGGGFIAVEFARDVELQSNDFGTTQENVVHYLRREWHSEMQDFGWPICLVQTGQHDAAIPNVTLQRYLYNVQWYATLLTTACDHIVWLSNASPASNDFAQTPAQTKEWNDAVHDLLKTYIGRDQTSFVDVYAASQDYPHSDNLHMEPQWYNALGHMLLQVMQYDTTDDSALASVGVPPVPTSTQGSPSKPP